MTGERVPMIMDVDTGVDDCLAILYVLATPEAELLALTCTSGNVPARRVARNNLALLELCEVPDVEVALGVEVPLVNTFAPAVSHGEQGLGYAELSAPQGRPSRRHSVDVIVDEARRRPGRLVLVVTGPLTNAALAVRKDPELPRLLKRLVVMGGSFDHEGNTTPASEWNVAVDPEAAKIVFAAFSSPEVRERPLVCGLNVTETVAMGPEHVRLLAEAAASTPDELLDPEAPPGTRSTASNPLVRCVSDAIRFHMEAYRSFGYGYTSHLHDVLAAALALEPVLAATRPATVDVELSGALTRGMTVADWRGLWGRPPNADVAVRTDPDAVLDRLITRVGALARRLPSSSA